MTRLAITGASGRMGRTTLETAADRPEITVVGAVSRSTADVSVPHHSSFERLLRDREPTVAVDFTAPSATAAYARQAADAGVAFVTGTTGLDETAEAALETAADSVPVLHARNFSRGVAALDRAVRTAVASLPGYDIELTETHHDGKRDAPSGTASGLLDSITAVRPEVAGRQHGRVGDAPRQSGEIGVHARRAGDVTGEHEVLIAGDEQTLRLTHRAGSRTVFAAGALDAASWVADQPPGRYTFDDVLDRGDAASLGDAQSPPNAGGVGE